MADVINFTERRDEQLDRLIVELFDEWLDAMARMPKRSLDDFRAINEELSEAIVRIDAERVYAMFEFQQQFGSEDPAQPDQEGLTDQDEAGSDENR